MHLYAAKLGAASSLPTYEAERAPHLGLAAAGHKQPPHRVEHQNVATPAQQALPDSHAAGLATQHVVVLVLRTAARGGVLVVGSAYRRVKGRTRPHRRL